MSAQAKRVVRAFVDRASLPEGALTVLCTGLGRSQELIVWVHPAFAHAISDLPRRIGRTPVCFQIKPAAHAY